MSYVKGLKCRECARHYPKEPIYVCEYCFGPLEVDYDYEKIKHKLTKDVLKFRPKICGAIKNSCRLIKSL